MSRIIYAIITSALFFYSCAGDGRIAKQLSSAESLIDIRPDSSLVILESIHPDHLKGKRDRAKYSLLYSKALDKNYIDIANDSIIRVAVAYYGDKENKDAMMSWYYSGIVHKNAGEWMPSMIAFDHARHIAEKTRDYHYLGLIHRASAEILNDCFDIESSISSYCESIAAFEKAGDSLYADHARLSLALAYNNALQFESEKKVLTRLMQKESIDPHLLSQVYRAYASCCLSSKPPLADSALYYYQLASSSPNPSRFRAHDILHLAYAYELSGNEEQADSMMHAVEGWPDQDGAKGYHHGWYLIYLHRGEYEAALHALEASLQNQTEGINHQLKESVSYALSQHYGRLAEKRREEMRRRTRTWSLLLISIIAICVYLYIVSRRKHRQLESQMRDTLLVSTELDQIKGMNAEISMILDHFVQDKISSMRILAEKYFQYNNRKGEDWLKEKKGIATKEELLSAFTKDIESLRSDHSLIDSLEARINLTTGNRFARLRSAVAEEEKRRKKKTALLSRSDYDIILLFLSRFPVKTICFLTGIPDYVVSERIYRFKTKLSFLPEEELAFLFPKQATLREFRKC